MLAQKADHWERTQDKIAFLSVLTVELDCSIAHVGEGLTITKLGIGAVMNSPPLMLLLRLLLLRTTGIRGIEWHCVALCSAVGHCLAVWGNAQN